MRSRMLCGMIAAAALLGFSQGAVAQSEPPSQAQPNPPSATPPNPSVVAPAEPSSQVPAQSETSVTPQNSTEPRHNSTTGAASTDVPTPRVVTHILSGQDAAKFNADVAADDAKPTLAHALGLTDEQKRLIASGVSKETPSQQLDFKPEVAALVPKSTKVEDLAADVTAKWSWLAPYKVAVVDNKILLVDPINSNLVVGMIDR